MFSNRLRKHLPTALTGIILVLSLLTSSAQGNQLEPPPGYYVLPPYLLPAKPTVLDKQLLVTMEKYKVVGLSAAVFNERKLIWNGSYGWADLATTRTVNAETLFRVASLSKMITATALMQLYEQGKFGLDDDISQYLGYQIRNPRYPDVKITFRQLLTHTSSIVDSGAYNTILEETPALLQEINIQDMLVPDGQYYDPDTFGNYAPGTQFSYSNFGTGIVGTLVEKISGLPFDKYCTKYIFKPLDMDASFEPSDSINWQNTAVLYRLDASLISFRPTKDNYNGTKPTPTTSAGSLAHSPAGGLRANSVDLAKFLQIHMNGGIYKQHTRILKSDTTDLMHSMQWFGYSMGGFYKQKGLNFHITDDLVPGKRLVGHSGEAYGLSSDAYYDPDSKLGIVFLMNGANLIEANPYYSVENAIAKTLFTTFAPKASNKPKQLKAKAGASFITVNNRKIFLQTPISITKTEKKQLLLLPAITAADALSAGLEQTDDTVTFTIGESKATLTAGKASMTVNGKTLALPQAPYKQHGQLLVPVRELAAALKIKIIFSL
ncbi:serine hydrolase [Sporomusa sp. KB1]|jgi:CubicO group peptidase (beta-lactamase class C family)|uniref:serine hydrolase n=1 Tax=Sporomusa sp. KB1 TaxID=943346 RepID=UPI00119E1471|nr:serine hydrolase [Sporomusa sp. KB1]TWH46684.1 CubicO group peptidase (beta-lactamase class C family) [Sporomusa sp. KB1]